MTIIGVGIHAQVEMKGHAIDLLYTMLQMSWYVDPSAWRPELAIQLGRSKDEYIHDM